MDEVTTTKAGRKPRKPKRKTSSRFKGWFKRPDLAEKMKAKWADPEYREKMKKVHAAIAERRKTDPNCTRAGVPDGMRRRTAKRMWAKAEEAADRFIQMLKDEGDLPQVTVPGTDEGMAEAALKEAFKLAVVPGDQKVRLAAIRTVLDFTKSKPESKSKVTIDTAEDWLKAAEADMKANG
jgi:hypothetical protein